MKLELNKQESDEVIQSLKRYFAAEMETDLSELRAKLLFDYFVAEFGPLAYNRGVQDAERFLRRQLEEVSGTCFAAPLTYWKSKRKP